MQAMGHEWPPEAMPPFLVPQVRRADTDSLYTLARRRAPLAPGPVVSPILDPTDVHALRAITLQELGQAITPAKIQDFVGQFFNGHRTLQICDLPLIGTRRHNPCGGVLAFEHCHVSRHMLYSTYTSSTYAFIGSLRVKGGHSWTQAPANGSPR